MHKHVIYTLLVLYKACMLLDTPRVIATYNVKNTLCI